MKFVECMDRWTFSDLTLGLLHVATRHRANRIQDHIPGIELPCGDDLVKLLSDFMAEVNITKSAYCIPDITLIERDSGGIILAGKIVYMHKSVELQSFRPAYFVAVDDKVEAVRVVVRGTQDFSDVLTDIVGHPVPYAGQGHVLVGFLRAAEWLLDNANSILAKTLKDHPGCVPIGVPAFMHSLFDLMSQASRLA
jgi:hypothetical protein